MPRKYTAQSLGTHKSPAGQTQKSAGAGGGSAMVQAQARPPVNDPVLDAIRLKALGGLLGFMNKKADPKIGEEIPAETGWTYRAMKPSGEILYQGAVPKNDISGYADDTIYDAVRFGTGEDGHQTVIDQFKPREGTLGYTDANGQRTSERTNLPWSWNTGNGGVASPYRQEGDGEKSFLWWLNPSNWG